MPCCLAVSLQTPQPPALLPLLFAKLLVIFNLEKLQPEIGILYPQRRAGGRMWGRRCRGRECGSPLQQSGFQGSYPSQRRARGAGLREAVRGGCFSLGTDGASAWIPMAKAQSSCRHINKSCCSRLWGESCALLARLFA